VAGGGWTELVLAARAFSKVAPGAPGAQPTTGGVVVVADSAVIDSSESSTALLDRRVHPTGLSKTL
jgi:hypothetical protein